MAAAEVAEDALAGGERNLVWELEDHAAQDLRGARGVARNPGRRAGILPAARGADQALSTVARQVVKTSGWQEFLSQPCVTRGDALPSCCTFRGAAGELGELPARDRREGGCCRGVRWPGRRSGIRNSVVL